MQSALEKLQAHPSTDEVLGAPIAVSPGEMDPDTRLRLLASFGKTKGFAQGATEDGLLGYLPFLKIFSGVAGSDEKKLKEAQDAIQGGIASQEQFDYYVSFLAKQSQKPSAGYHLAKGLQSSVAFGGEIAATGGLAALGKGAAVKGMAKLGVKAGVARGLVGVAAGEAARQTGIDLLKTGLDMAFKEDGTPTWSPADRDAFMRGMPEWSISVTDDGKLQLVMEKMGKEIGDEKFNARLSGYFELLSERMGPALGAAFSKLPLGGKLMALEADVFKWMRGKGYSKTLDETLALVGQKAQVHSMLEEYLEERAGDLLRGLTPGMEETLADVIPSWEQSVGELGAAAVPGAVRAVGGRAFGQSEESLQKVKGDIAALGSKEGQLVSQAAAGEDVQTAEPLPQTDPGKIDSVAAKGLQKLQDELGDSEAVSASVPDSDAARELESAAQAQGMDVRWFSTESGKASRLPAMQAGEGVVLMDTAVLEDPAAARKYLRHEAFHDIGSKNKKLLQDTLNELARFDAPGLAAAMRSIQADRAGGISDRLILEEGGARRSEEVEALTSYLQSERGAEWLADLEKNEDRTTLQKVIDFVKTILQKFKIPTQTFQQQKLAELELAIGEGVTPGDLASARVIRSALEAAMTAGEGVRMAPSKRPTVGRPLKNEAEGGLKNEGVVEGVKAEPPYQMSPEDRDFLSAMTGREPASGSQRKPGGTPEQKEAASAAVSRASDRQTHYMGHKTEFLQSQGKHVADLLAGAEVEEVFDWYAGGGTYGLSLVAEGALPNVKRVTLNEIDTDRYNRTTIAFREGSGLLDAWDSNPFLVELRDKLRELRETHDSSSPSGAAIDYLSGAKEPQKREKYKWFLLNRSKYAALSSREKAAIVAFQDVTFSGRTASWATLWVNAKSDLDNLQRHYAKARARGVEVRQVSMDATSQEAVALVRGTGPSMLLLDPPYHETAKGTYRGEGIDYKLNGVEFLVKNVEAAMAMSRGNAMLYHNKNTTQVRGALAGTFGSAMDTRGWERNKGGKEIAGYYDDTRRNSTPDRKVGDSGPTPEPRGTRGEQRLLGKPGGTVTRSDGPAPSSDAGGAGGPTDRVARRERKLRNKQLQEQRNLAKKLRTRADLLRSKGMEAGAQKLEAKIPKLPTENTRRAPVETRAQRAARLFEEGEEDVTRFAVAPKAWPVVAAGELSDGRTVRAGVPNEASISSTLSDWDELPGIRDVPMSAFPGAFTGRHYSVNGTERIKELASEIEASGEISPLIVVVDAEGPYILEGATRVEALYRLGAKSFPAKVVLDGDSAPPRFAAAPRTDSEAFKKWFGDSKVVDENGEPLVVYHSPRGGADRFESFDPSRVSGQGVGGFWFSVNRKYAEYVGKVPAMRFYLRMENPGTFDDRMLAIAAVIRSHPDVSRWEQPAEFNRLVVEHMRSAGFDGWIGSDMTEMAVFDDSQAGRIDTAKPPNELSGERLEGFTTSPRRERSQDTGGKGKGQGTYDPSNPDIRFAAAAYHGSPHEFDKFTTNKIGTGEGAQAYGWGLYFASAKKVADWYKKQLSVITFKGTYVDLEDPMPHETIPRHGIEALLRVSEAGGLQAAIRSIEMEADNPPIGGSRALADKKLAWLKANAHYIDGSGKGYEVTLAPDESEYLLWDEPLSRQSDVVKGALGSLPPKLFEQSGMEDWAHPGAGFVGKELYEAFDIAIGNQRAASLALLSSGIRGIKYLDGSSRSKGEGAYNYVLFDESDVEITGRFAAKPGASLIRREFAGFDAGKETLPQAIRRTAQDEFIRVKVYEQGIRDAGGKVPPSRSVYRAMEMMTGQNQADQERLQRKFFNPIIRMLNKAGIKASQFDEYLYALHAVERNREMRKKAEQRLATLTGKEAAALRKQLEDPAFGSGMSNKQAGDIKRSVHQQKEADIYRKAAGLVHEMNRATVATQVRMGLLTQETADAWAAQYENYVPLRTAVEGATPGTGAGVSIGGQEVKGAKGRSRLAHSPFTFSVEQAERAIVRGHKNQVGNKFLELVKAYPQLMMEVREETAEPDDSTGDLLPQEPRPAEDEFSTKVDGKQVYIRIKDKLLRRALKNLGRQPMSKPLQVASKIMRFLSAINTSFDPGFIISNLLRDAQTAGINLSGEQSGAFARKVMRYTFSGAPGAAVWRAAKEKENPEGEWDQYYQRLSDAGGLTGWYHSPSFEERAKDIQKEVDRNHDSPAEQARAVLLKAGAFVSDLNEAVENNVRLAAFRVAVDSGMTDSDAASLSKNLTVNFNRKGERGSIINSMYLFYNASVQGSMRMLTAMKNPTVRRIMLGIAGGAFLVDMVNRGVGGDDEDGISYYDKIPEWVKARNAIFMLPNGNHIKIPLPYGYNVAWSMGQQLSSMANGPTTAEDAAVNLISTAWESFYPLGSEASLTQTLLPTLVDPIIQLGENKNFTGAPIMPSQGFGLKEPDSQMYWDSVSPPLKAVTEFLNSATGGDAVEPGWIDVSPETLEHLYEFISGGVGRQGNRITKVASAIAKGEAPEIRDIPILRRVLGAPDGRFDREAYTERRDAVKIVEAQLKEYPQRAAQIRREKHRLVQLIKPMKDAESKLRKLRTMSRAAKTDAQKDEFSRRMEAVRARFSKQYLEINP